MTQIVKALRARLAARPDSEHEQAILRIVIVGVVLLYMGLTYSGGPTRPGHGALVLIQGLAADFIFSLLLFGAICRWPAPNVPRRAVGMLADAGAATFCMFLAGESGVSMIGVYLFITFGNGFRYGRKYLFACQLLCLGGFAAVLLWAPYWANHQVAGWGLMIALVVLPLYVSTLLKRIHEARAKAEEANRAKSSFLANMSHEMRTPLNGIVGVTDLLQTTQLSVEQTELMRLLRHSVSLLRSLVDDVLDISKIEAGRLSIEMVDFDLHGVLNGLIRLLRPHATAKGLVLRAMVDPAIDYNLRGDPHHLRQVLVNLVSNAIKFTARGEIELSCMLLANSDDGYRVRFAVRDTGIGISEDAQKKIFEEFVQADDSTTRRYGGTGLGTSIAKQLVELMGGTIGLQSRLGEGSTFWFEVPLLKALSTRRTETELGEPSTTGVIVADAAPDKRLYSAVASACTTVEIVGEASALDQVRQIRARGQQVAAVVMGHNPLAACKLFDVLSDQESECPMALIYIGEISDNNVRARLRQVDGAVVLSAGVDARVLRNAIHAATTRDARSSAEVIDLGTVLRDQRQALRILVAEDNETNQTIIRQLLESAGHTVLLASDGEEALDLYEDERPDLALLDFNMPERSGVEVVTVIRTMEPTNTRLPIIILSASVTLEARELARNAGADEFVGKPYEAANLLQVIDRIARRVTKGTHTPYHTSQGTVVQAPLNMGGVPLIDHDRIRDVERLGTSPQFMQSLLKGFEADVRGILQRVEAANRSGMRGEIKDLAHALRGAALGIGAQQLAARSQVLEAAASAAADDRHMDALVLEVRRCYEQTIKQLDALAFGEAAPNDTTRSRFLH
jgi:two-component system, sensor histidine kinase RpfC